MMRGEFIGKRLDAEKSEYLSNQGNARVAVVLRGVAAADYMHYSGRRIKVA